MSGKCSKTSICQHHIRTARELPVRQRPYRIPQICREAVEKEIEMMLREGVIEPCSSQLWSLRRKVVPFIFMLIIGN